MRRARVAPLLAVAAILAALAATTACDGRRHKTPSSAESSHDEPTAGPAVAILDLSDGVPEQPPTGLLGLSPKGASFDDLVREVERLGRDKEVRGVLVRLGTARVGLARAQEIGALVGTLGAKLPVWCHADDLSNGTLYLAVRACKRTWLSPASSVDAVGLAAQTMYFHKLLADELGLDVDFLQVGKYKGAEEPFTRDGPSPEARASLQSTLSDMRAVWLEGLRAARPAMAETTPEDGPYGARTAKELGLIDDVGYFDEEREALQKEAGAIRAEVRLGGGAASGGGDDLSDVLRAIAGESLGAAPVALVRADGAISMEGGAGLLSEGGGIVERRLVRTLTKLEHDDDVKAVVLRIDSPGGSALASDLLWHQLMRVRAKKPLVVSVGGMAASGGYYLASTGAVVYADDTSIVGSIGVVGGKIAAAKALERFGVHAETIAAKPDDPRAAARAAYASLLVPWDDATRERMLSTMTAIYDLFLARVAEGRNIPIERVAASAEGRIFSGREGKTRGLVDELGGLTDAVARARAMAGLAADARVGVVGESSGLLQALEE
ncbi:MAG TPA: S49 family peptidase, partial [Polyangiaceae bacterium]|nr:S49 family peptidase [Polyangiaceae bacterium]